MKMIEKNGTKYYQCNSVRDVTTNNYIDTEMNDGTVVRNFYKNGYYTGTEVITKTK